MIVTKEDKEIAVGMWESIRDDWVKNPSVPLANYKYRYLSRFGYENTWRNNCLLCSYYSYYADGTPRHRPACTQCPLSSCTESHSDYMLLLNKHTSIEIKIEACNRILQCIEDIEVEVTDEKA